MVAFNFRKEFVDKIINEEKYSTIRKTKRCNVGDRMQLYTGQRTKHCQKIADAVCIATAKVSIDEYGKVNLTEIDGDRRAIPLNKTDFIYMEGFNTLDDMIDFFQEWHGLPFEGYMHVWGLEE